MSNISWLPFNRPDPTAVYLLLDRLYRISIQDLQEFLHNHFSVRLIAANHRFLLPPSKHGADTEIFHLLPPNQSSRITFPLTRARGPVKVSRFNNLLEFDFRSSTQEFTLQFEASDANAAENWNTILTTNSVALSVAFVYIFHRHRASSAIEAQETLERNYLTSLMRNLRDNQTIETAFHSILNTTDFESCILLGYVHYSKLLVPLYSTSLLDTMSPTVQVSVQQLHFWEDFLTSDDGVLIRPLSQGSQYGPNCAAQFTNGARRIAILRIGRDQSGGRSQLRAVLCLYSKHTEGSKNDGRLQSLLRSTARELAAWIDELDEMIEHSVITQAITTTEQYCTLGMTSYIHRDVFDKILTELGAVASASLQSTLFFRGSSNNNVACFFKANNDVYGGASPLRTPEVDAFVSILKEDGLFYNAITPQIGVMAYVRAETKTIFFVVAPIEDIAVLRLHLYECLFNVMSLVYHLVQLEKRRVSWIQRTIHEIRHPLQGLIAMSDTLRFSVESPIIPRRELPKYLEDLETNIIRLRVMLNIFENATGLDKIQPKPTLLLIEDNVMRPIRRLLQNYARKKRVKLGETYGYETIPQLRSDADLLTIIFYNLVDNAIKYATKGTEVSVYCDSDDSHFMISVENYGTPITASDSNHLFENGYRGENATSTEVGLGLGLYISSVIAAKLGCKVELTSAGDSTNPIIFTLMIPIETAARRS